MLFELYHKLYDDAAAHVKYNIAYRSIIYNELILFGIVRKTEEKIAGVKSYSFDGKHFYFNPPLTFQLEADDSLILMGRRHHIIRLEEEIEQSTL